MLCGVAGLGRQSDPGPTERTCKGGGARPQSGPGSRGRGLRSFYLVLGLSLLVALPVGAQDIWVSIVEPRDGDFVIGELDVVVEVVSRADIAEIEFQLDGRPIGTLSMEPYRMPVDLGEKNVPHHFSVVAVDVDGNRASHSVNTQPMPISAD